MKKPSLKTFKLRINFKKKKILAIILASLGLLILAFLVITKTSSEPERKIIYPEVKLSSKENKTTFRSHESPQFILNLGEKKEKNEPSGSIFLKQVLADTEPEIKAIVSYMDNEPIKELTDSLKIEKTSDGQYNFTIPQPKSFRPGKYQLIVTLEEENAIQEIIQDFTWGVLAINTNKSIFGENEKAAIYFGVVNDMGSTICNAQLYLTIKDPNGQVTNLSTEEETIKYSGECARDNVTYIPDYSAVYQTGNEGIYQMELTSQTKNGEYQITDFFEVRKEVPFEIERIGPTRINPVAEYDFKIKVKANQDFEGEIIEELPQDFVVRGEGFEEKSKDKQTKLIVWQVKLKKDEVKELAYSYDAPDMNPEFYLLGPLKLISNEEIVFQEIRQWQIAVDGAGQFILLWDGGTAPTGWTIISDGGGEDFYDVFPRGAASYGVGTTGAATHTHVITYQSETTSSVDDGFDDGSGDTVSTTAHVHGSTGSPNVVAASNNPSYRSLKFIRSNAASPSTIPNGVIGIFDTTSLPTNWGSYSSQDTYFLRGGASVGTDGQNTHTHSTSATLNASANTVTIKSSSTSAGPNTTHTHSCSGASDEKDQQPPYLEVVFAKTTQDTSVPSGLIAMFDATVPSGWESVSDASDAFDGNFIKGDSSTPGGTGGAVQHVQHGNLAMNCSATSDTSLKDISPAQAGALANHTHTATVSYTQDNNLPVYRDTIFGKKLVVVEGTIYSDEGVTPIDCTGENLTVKVLVNGANAQTGTCDQSSGDYTVSGVVVNSADDVITAYLDEEDPDATAVTLAAAAGQAPADLDLYQNRIIVRHESSGPITNEDLDQYDSGGDADIEFTVTGTYDLEVLSGSELHIWDSDTYDPGGTVITNATGGILHLDDNSTAYLDAVTSNIGNNIDIDTGATLNIDANTIVQGNITVAGTLTKSTGSPTVTLRGTNNISGAGSITFYNLAVGDATGTSATTFSSSTEMTGGALTTYDTSTISTSGTPNVNVSGGTGNIGGGGGAINFYDLTIGGTQTLQSNITVSNNLSASGSLALNDKNISITNGDFATTGGGTITCSGCLTGTATLSGSSKNIGGGGSVTVYDLAINGSYTLQSAAIANNDISIGTSGSLALNDEDLTVGDGDLTTTSNGTITCAGCAAGTTTVNGSATTGIGGGSGEITFYNLTIGGTIPIVSDITALSDLAVNGTMSGSSNVTVNGAISGTGTVNMSGGTVEQRIGEAENFGGTNGNGWTFSTLMFSNSSGVSPFTVTTQADSGGITVSTLLQIGKGGDTENTVLSAGNRTWTLSGTNGTPFDIIGSSSLTPATSTFSFTGDNGGGDTTVQTTTYYDLVFDAAETFNAEGSITANDDLTITTGTLAMGANALIVGSTGVTDSGDISVATSQSLTQSASATTTVKTSVAGSATVGGAGTLTFYNLTLAPDVNGATIYLGSAGGQTITVSNDLTIGNGSNTVTVNADSNDPDLDINGNFTIDTNGTFQASQTGTFEIQGSYSNSGTFTHNDGLVKFNDTAGGKNLSGTMTGSSAFYDLTFDGVSGGWTFGGNAAVVANNFTITNGTVTAPSNTLTITGSYSNSGTFTHNDGEVIFNDTVGSKTLAGAMTSGSSFYNLTFNGSGGGWTFGGNAAAVANDFGITNGSVTAPSSSLTIGGNFDNSDSFAHNDGAVIFNNSGKTSTLTYVGATTFYGFTVNTSSKEIYFDNLDQTNVTNAFTIDGTACGTMVKLYSDSSGNKYDLNVTAVSPSIQYADIKDSNAVTGLIASDSKSSGNVSGWTIGGGTCGGVTVSGNAYEDEGSTDWTGCDDLTLNLSLVINGTLEQVSSCDSSTGAYAFYTVTLAINNPVSVFFNATDKGAAVTVAADDSSSITLNPRKNITWVKTEGAISSITNANLDHCDSGSPVDCANIPYSVSTNNLTTESGIKLYIESSKTYDPGGIVTTNATGGDFHVDDNATAYLDTSGSSIGRDILVDDSATLNIQANTTIGRHLTTSGNSVNVTYTNAPTLTMSGGNIGGGSSPNISFYDLIISGATIMNSASTTANNLTVNGTMSGSSNVTVNGAISGTGTVNMSGGTVEQRIGEAENFGGTNGNGWTFSTLMFSNSSGVSPFTVTTQADSGGITVSTLLQIGKGGDTENTVLSAGNRTWTLSGTNGTPFDIIGSSSLTPATSTFSFTGDNGGGDTTVQTTTYYDLVFDAAETFNAEGSITANDDLTITTGTLAMGANALIVGSTGVTDSGDISVATSQSLTQSASATTTVKTSVAGSATVGGAGTLTFYNLTLAPDVNGATIYLGSAGGQTITVSNDLTIGNGSNTVTVNADSNDPDLDINGNFTIDTNGTFQASGTGAFEIAKNFTNNNVFTHNSGTVTFDTAETTIFNGSGTPAITFNNFTAATAGKTLQFTESKTFRIEGLFTVTGQSDNKININSTSSTQWLVDHQGTESITYVDLQNSGCAGGTTSVSLDPTTSNQGNNDSCWLFQIGKRIKGNVTIMGGVRIK